MLLPSGFALWPRPFFYLTSRQKKIFRIKELFVNLPEVMIFSSSPSTHVLVKVRDQSREALVYSGSSLQNFKTQIQLRPGCPQIILLSCVKWKKNETGVSVICVVWLKLDPQSYKIFHMTYLTT